MSSDVLNLYKSYKLLSKLPPQTPGFPSFFGLGLGTVIFHLSGFYPNVQNRPFIWVPMGPDSLNTASESQGSP